MRINRYIASSGAMKAAANQSFGYNEDQIVSSDVIGMRFGSLFDATQTMVSKDEMQFTWGAMCHP